MPVDRRLGNSQFRRDVAGGRDKCVSLVKKMPTLRQIIQKTEKKVNFQACFINPNIETRQNMLSSLFSERLYVMLVSLLLKSIYI